MKDWRPPEWHPVEIARGTLAYCARNRGVILSLASRYWDGKLDSLEVVREHDWGGKVSRGYSPLDGKLYYFKRFSIRNPTFLRKPPLAHSTIRQQRAMRAAGFHTPESVCLVERSWAGILIDAAVISEPVDNEGNLHELTCGSGGSAGHRSRRLELLRRFAGELGDFHRAGLFHGKLELRNILLRDVFGNEQFVWLDNEAGRAFPRLPFRNRVEDLGHLNVHEDDLSNTDRLRFWNAYKRVVGLSRRDAATLSEKIVRRVLLTRVKAASSRRTP